MIRDKLLDRLSLAQGTETTKSLTESCCDAVTPESLAAVELLCRFTTEVSPMEGGWSVGKKNKTGKVLAMIENYSITTGKKIFRLTAALQELPPHEHPTQDEIEKVIDLSNGKFKLLPNAMIKRNS